MREEILRQLGDAVLGPGGLGESCPAEVMRELHQRGRINFISMAIPDVAIQTTQAPASPPLRDPGAIVLLSCYELGHQPLGIAWPKAFLERAGFAPDSLDLALEPWDDTKIRRAQLVAIAVPMHTALRLGVRAAERIRRENPRCRIVFHGLYALLNADYLLGGLADEVFGGEFEEEFVEHVDRLERGESPRHTPHAARKRLDFPAPSRASLPGLTRYVKLQRNEVEIPAGYVEASRGCLHHCLHCPIPPVYDGRFFVVPPEIVLADIRRLVAAGAGHITFGDPDFLNGPGHALKLVRALHAEFPGVTYDFTAKIEHLLRHRAHLPEFARTGCAFIVSAVESLSDVVLSELEKGHTRADALTAFDLTRRAGIPLRPSLIPFTPWETLDSYRDLVDFFHARDLVDQVDPVQLTIRLLIPPGSALLTRPAIQPFLGALDPAAFTYRWTHPDPRMDALHAEVSAQQRAGGVRRPPPERPIPARLTEPWFC